MTQQHGSKLGRLLPRVTHNWIVNGGNSNEHWQEAAELLHCIPFFLFCLPHLRGLVLVAVQKVASLTTIPEKGVPSNITTGESNESIVPTAGSTNSTPPKTALTRNRFARSFSQLVASQLVTGDLVTMAKSQGILTNMGVDYVVVFRFATTGLSPFMPRAVVEYEAD